MRVIAMVFVLLFFGTSCDLHYIKKTPYLPGKQFFADYIRLQTAVHLEKEKRLVPCGITGQMIGEIKMLGLSFKYYKEIGIEEMRELLITAGMSLLNAINSDESIRPYLDKFPFEIRNIEIKIFLLKPNLTQCELDKLHYATMIDGILEYVIRSSDTQYRTICTETYEEALESGV